MTRWLFPVLVIGALGALAGCAGPAAAPVPAYQVVPTPSAGESVTVGTADGGLTVEVRSERGIGKAVVTQTAGANPGFVQLRMHLKALEELRFGYRDTEVRVAVGTNGGVAESVVLPGGTEQQIDPASPYWMAVQIVAEDPTIPLEDGYFQVDGPPDLLGAAPPGWALKFALNWIDFYR